LKYVKQLQLGELKERQNVREGGKIFSGKGVAEGGLKKSG